MNRYTDEDIIAFVDGRLPAAAHAQMEAAANADAALAARIAHHQWLAGQIGAAFGPPPAFDADADLIARLGLSAGWADPQDNVVAMATRRSRQPTPWHRRAGWLTAVAASLAVGVLVGRAIPPAATTLEATPGGALIAGPTLAAALDSQLAGQAAPIRIGLSFRTQRGLCRTFVMPGGTSGLGCRAGEGWQVPIVAAPAASPGTGSEYRLAGGDAAAVVMAQVDRMIIGEPLSPADERRAQRQGWR